ncbi:hypothetical protein PAL_GLEAN10012209 [Pteropus alecto]|uniref:Uncharacterized protein n=1 Tax=Pteropus alecto TaxID=9402 RepID=L5KBN7_PTEAL|nr:hypothetical protein PAL_GLEAN10012209 [Pteropus alecto]
MTSSEKIQKAKCQNPGEAGNAEPKPDWRTLKRSKNGRQQGEEELRSLTITPALLREAPDAENKRNSQLRLGRK